MADDYERLTEKTELSLWRTTCDPAEAEIVGVGVPPSGNSNDRPLLLRWLTEARWLEMSRLKPCGSDTYAPAPNCHWRRSGCPEVSR
jgi:hypothetical protein